MCKTTITIYEETNHQMTNIWYPTTNYVYLFSSLTHIFSVAYCPTSAKYLFLSM